MERPDSKKAYGFIDAPDFSQQKGKGKESVGNDQSVIEISDLYAGAEGLGVTTDREFIKANVVMVEEGR